MATPRMWRRTGDYRQRHKISPLRQHSTDIEPDRRMSIGSSNTTSSAVVHTPMLRRPASPQLFLIIARSFSYLRKPAAPVYIAEGVMFADEDVFNKNIEGLALPFGRVHSLDSTNIADSALVVPRKTVTHHAALSHASSGSRVKPQCSIHANLSNGTYGQSVTDGGNDDLRDYRRKADRMLKGKENPEDIRRGVPRSARGDDPKRMTSLYRCFSAHHQRSTDYVVSDTTDPKGNMTSLTGNILGTVLSGSSGGNKSIHSKTVMAGMLEETPAETRIRAIGKVDVWSLGRFCSTWAISVSSAAAFLQLQF